MTPEQHEAIDRYHAACAERLTIVEAPTAMDALRNEWAKKQIAAQRKTNRWFGLALILMGLTILALVVLLIAAESGGKL